jgi:hypothetical protein
VPLQRCRLDSDSSACHVHSMPTHHMVGKRTSTSRAHRTRRVYRPGTGTCSSCGHMPRSLHRRYSTSGSLREYTARASCTWCISPSVPRARSTRRECTSDIGFSDWYVGRSRSHHSPCTGSSACHACRKQTPRTPCSTGFCDHACTVLAFCFCFPSGSLFLERHVPLREMISLFCCPAVLPCMDPLCKWQSLPDEQVAETRAYRTRCAAVPARTCPV